MFLFLICIALPVTCTISGNSLIITNFKAVIANNPIGVTFQATNPVAGIYI